MKWPGRPWVRYSQNVTLLAGMLCLSKSTDLLYKKTRCWFAKMRRTTIRTAKHIQVSCKWPKWLKFFLRSGKRGRFHKKVEHWSNWKCEMSWNETVWACFRRIRFLELGKCSNSKPVERQMSIEADPRWRRGRFNLCHRVGQQSKLSEWGRCFVSPNGEKWRETIV